MIRSDLIEAFPDLKSTSSASRLINESLIDYEEYLTYEKKSVLPRPGVKLPEFINDEHLINDLDANPSYENIGLSETELPRFLCKTTYSCSKDSSVMNRLFRLAADDRPFEIAYVGIKKGDEAAYRTIYASYIEKKDNHWRLVAYDLDDPAYPTKVFLFSRILDVRETKRKPRKTRVDKDGRRRHFDYSTILNRPSVISVPVEYHPELTVDQKKAVDRQFRIKDKKIEINDRDLFEFEIDYCGKEVSDRVCWPLIKVKR